MHFKLTGYYFDNQNLKANFGFGKYGKGVAFSNGDLWQEQRAITMTSFRKLGINTNAMAERIYEIAAINNELIAKQNGQPLDLEEVLTPSISNVISSIIFGWCFEYNDAEFIKAIYYIRRILADGGAGNLATYFPNLSLLPGDMFKLKKIKERGSYVMDYFLKKNIQKCRRENTDLHNLNNFITMYIAQIDKKLKAGQSTTLTNENLMLSVYDLFAAGLETTSTTLKWCILHFLHYPETQEKVYIEIEKEVGIARPPNMSDKDQLPYLNAFIKETQRIASIFPLNVMHVSTKTTSLSGYTIPKGTQVIPCLDSVLHDEKIWGEDVNMFRPERFLNKDGKVKYTEEFVPFSLGKRICPGATLAKMQLFLFLSWMVQRFEFLPPNPGRLPSLTPVYGLTACPANFQVRAVERNM